MGQSARWLKAWSWTGWCLAVPAVGFAAFFIHAAANETGGWHPSPNEMWAVPLIMLAALLLPTFSAMLWHAAGGGKKTGIGMAMSAVAAILVGVLGFSGGMAARPYWIRSISAARPFTVRLTPEAVEGDGLSLFAPVNGAGLPANEFRAVTTIAKPRHVAVLTLEAESAAGKDTLSGQSYYFVALDKSAPISTTASWKADTRADGLVSFRLEVDGQHATGHWIDSSGPVEWLNGFVWSPVSLPRSHWVGPGEWRLNDTNTLTIFEGVKAGNPVLKATVRLRFSLHRLPEGFVPADSGRVIKVGTMWRSDLGLAAEPALLPSPGASDDRISKQERLRAIALESVAQAVRTGDLHILHEPGITPRERTHDPETGYPILVVPVGEPEASALFNEAMRAYFRDQKSAKKEAK